MDDSEDHAYESKKSDSDDSEGREEKESINDLRLSVFTNPNGKKPSGGMDCSWVYQPELGAGE